MKNWEMGQKVYDNFNFGEKEGEIVNIWEDVLIVRFGDINYYYVLNGRKFAGSFPTLSHTPYNPVPKFEGFTPGSYDENLNLIGKYGYFWSKNMENYVIYSKLVKYNPELINRFTNTNDINYQHFSLTPPPHLQ